MMTPAPIAAARGAASASPRVSVVMPVLDGGAFLSQAIASVLSQSVEDFELLVVDDGSTDGSDAVVRDAAAGDPRVRLLTHPGRENRGMSASRNLALAAARADYVAFLDADDVWLPEMLSNGIALLDAHPEAGMVVGSALYWHGWTGRVIDGVRDHVVSSGYPSGTTVPGGGMLVRWLREPGLVPCPGAVMVRRLVLQAAGGHVDAFRGLYEDQVLFAKMALAAPAVATGACLLLYRQHPDSACARGARDGSEVAARRQFLEWLAGYVGALAGRHDDLRSAIVSASVPASMPAAPSLGAHARAAAKAVGRAVLPRAARRVLRDALRPADQPQVGAVTMADLRRTAPFCRAFGYSRGTPVDRRYIEAFLSDHAADVRGRTLEVGDATYSLRFGGVKIRRPDVLHVDPSNPNATYVANLEAWSDAPADTFDCIVLTQTLHLVYDMRGALAALHRALAPGGVLLVTSPGISPVDRDDWGEHWYWSLTPQSMTRLLADAFGPGCAVVRSYGNVLTASAFLYGMAAEELTDAEYAVGDAAFPVIVAGRAVKGAPTA